MKIFPGRVVVNLVREFLEFFKLDYTVAVFEPESNSVSCFINFSPMKTWSMFHFYTVNNLIFKTSLHTFS